MAWFEKWDNWERGYEIIKTIWKFFKSNDISFCDSVYELFRNVSFGVRDAQLFSEEFIDHVSNNSKLVKSLKEEYERCKNEKDCVNIFRKDNVLQDEIKKEFKKYKNNIKKFKDIFEGEDDKYCYALYELFRDIQSSLSKSEKDLIFDKNFIRAVHQYKWNSLKHSYSTICGGNIEKFKKDAVRSRVEEQFYRFLNDVHKETATRRRENQKKARDRSEVPKTTAKKDTWVLVRLFKRTKKQNDAPVNTNYSGNITVQSAPTIQHRSTPIIQQNTPTFQQANTGQRNTPIFPQVDTEQQDSPVLQQDASNSEQESSPTLQQNNPDLEQQSTSANTMDFLSAQSGNLIEEFNDFYKGVKDSLVKNGLPFVSDEMITAYIMYVNHEALKDSTDDQRIIEEIMEYWKAVELLLTENLYRGFDFSDRNISEKDKSIIINAANKAIKESGELWKLFSDTNNLNGLKNNIKTIAKNLQIDFSSLTDKKPWIDFITYILNNYLENKAVDLNSKRCFSMLYAQIIEPPINTENMTVEEIDKLVMAFNGGTNEFTETLTKFSDEREERDFEWKMDYAVRSLTERYEMGQETAENRRFYESDFLTINEEKDETGNPSWRSIISGINNIDSKLNHYKIKSNRTEHEDTSLRYTAFDITFNNAFNLDSPTIQKLANLKIDLRSEISSYWIYNPDNNSFNKIARDRFVTDKLLNKWLTPQEIENLWKAMESLPAEFDKNYKILCWNFDADQETFEKISKIYALGEVIDNIKKLFSRWKFIGLQLDENAPADIVGNCLFIKWKVNWAETNIKYDLNTWLVYINSFTDQYGNSRIVVWNTEPNTKIGDFGSFEESISNLDSVFPIQNDEDLWNNNWDKPEDKENTEQNSQNYEDLLESKLNSDLDKIWEIVKIKAWEQWYKNSIINDLLKTFNILPESWEPKDIEFMWWSSLFSLIESITLADNEKDLKDFSDAIKELMSLCCLSWWKNNENPSFSSITIFDIGKDNDDIISLQEAHKSFFSGEDSEKDKIKSKKNHFDSSIQLSLVNIIVQKWCRRNHDWILAEQFKNFVDRIRSGISDKKDVAAIEDVFKSDAWGLA